MPGRLAIDFGTSNTVIAVWDAKRHEGVPLHLAEYGRQIKYRGGDPAEEPISVIPSLIHYGPDGRRWLGQQVLQQNLYDSERTVRWMKRYISRRSPIKLRLDDGEVSYQQAGRDFLSGILAAIGTDVGLGDEEVAFTAPVEAFEHYENWLREVAEETGMPRFRLIDEPSAAALGYGAHIQPGDVYLIFDFGGGTLDVAVVLMEEEANQASGRRCRVLGKAGADIGGATIDGWLFQDFLRQNQRHDSDEDIRPLSRALLVACERAKERLSFQDEIALRLPLAENGPTLQGVFTRRLLEQMFDAHGAFTQVDHTIRRALNATRERGYEEEHIKAVLLVGGTSLIPSIQQTVQRIFGRERVMLRRPLDAVARGAAAFVAGVDFYDHIQHDYAFRHVNPAKGDYEYRPIVRRGTSYPSTEPVARLTIKASHNGQTHLGVAIFELGEQARRGDGQPVELVFDPQGAARLRHVTPEEEERQYYFWINENNPTFLQADPPAVKGEPRFEVEFGIDANKRLLITARDLKTKRLIYRNHPVVQLV